MKKLFSVFSVLLTVVFMFSSVACKHEIQTERNSFSDKSITITFYSNSEDGVQRTETQSVKANRDASLRANSFERTGYSFVGWSESPSDGAAVYADSANVSFSESKTLYAVWEAIKYYIVYDTQGGMLPEDREEEELAMYDTALNLPEATMESNKFLGWYTNIDEESSRLSKYAVNLTDVQDEIVTLHAKWVADNDAIEIVFHSNDGTDRESDPQYAAKGQNVMLEKNPYERTGYDFLGWAENDSSDVALYREDDDSIPQFDENTDLYAVWSAHEYYVEFDTQGGEPVDGVTVTYDTPWNLPEVDKVGYEFLGWSLSAKGEIRYSADETEGGNLSEDKDVTVRLYALWTPVEYTVIFDVDGDTSLYGSIETVYDSTWNLPSPNPTKQDYTFMGWALTQGDFPKYSRNQTKGDNEGLLEATDGTLTLYAVFNSNICNITFDKNAEDAAGTMDIQEVPLGEQAVLSSNQFTRAGYKFAGWNKDSQTKEVQYTDGGSFTTEWNVTLYAVWTPITYTIVFYPESGAADSVIMENVAYDTEDTFIDVPFSVTGYHIASWQSDAHQQAFAYNACAAGLTTEENGVVSLYANWEPNTYTIAFDVDDVDPVVATYDQDAVLPDIYPMKAGYGFAHWILGGNIYPKGATVRNLATGDEGDETITLTAVWEPIRLSNIVIVEEPENTTVVYGEEPDLSDVKIRLVYNGGRTEELFYNSNDFSYRFDNELAGNNRTMFIQYGENVVEVGSKFTIVRKVVELDWSNSTKIFEYDGENHAPEVPVINGLVNDDVCFVTTTEGEMLSAGNHTLTVTGLSNFNYDIPADGTQSCEYTIAPKPLTFVWDDSIEFTYDAQPHQAEVLRIEGLVNGDKCSVTGYANNSKTDAGSYTAEVTMLSNSNYTVDGSTGSSKTWKIKKAEVTVTAPVGITNLRYTGSALNLVSEGSASEGAEIKYSTDNITYDTNVVKGTDASSYTVYWKAVLTDSKNYKLPTASSGSVSVTIEKMAGNDYIIAETLEVDSAESQINGLSSSKRYQYSSDGSTWTDVAANSTAITDLAPGKYYVRYKGDSNHEDGKASSAFVIVKVLSGLFTVDSKGTKVRFSSGALYWDGAAYAFEENQYDYRTKPGVVSVVNGVTGTTEDNNVGLFVWTPNEDEAYLLTWNPGSSFLSGDVFFASNNSNVIGSDWYTLTYEQFHYLFNSRTNASSKWSVGRIKLSDNKYVRGAILLPDSWTKPSGCSFTAGAVSSSDVNTYSLTDWAKMEANGAVFLPRLDGYSGRESSNDTMRTSTSETYYWYSSLNTSDSNAKYFSITNTKIELGSYAPRTRGYMVRMVKNN